MIQGTSTNGKKPLLRISFVGDIALNGGYEKLREEETSSLGSAVSCLLSQSDLAIGNLEGPLTTSADPGPPWRFNLHGNPKYVPILRSAGFHVLSLANNHIMDHGRQGLEETMAHLDANGIQYAGAGRNLAEARKPLLLSINGTKIGFLAYCAVPSLFPYYASEDGPGAAPLKRELVFDDIGRLKKQCDITVLSIHWGEEHVALPSPQCRQLAKELVGAGASIVVGHHPHVLQGVERREQGVIAYSLGNFTFSDQQWVGTNKNGESFTMPYILNERNRRSAVWKVDIDQQKEITQELVPVYLDRDLLPKPDGRPERIDEMAKINATLTSGGYGRIWRLNMISRRVKTVLAELRGERSLVSRLLQARPRHLRVVAQTLVREWDHFRGLE